MPSRDDHAATRFTTRRAVDSDVERLVELSLDAWTPVFASFRAVFGEELYDRIHPDWRADQATSVRTAIAANATWVAEDHDRSGASGTNGDRVVGFVNVVFDEANRSGEIYMIAVDPTAQRQGVASELTALALNEMRARGIDLAIVATGGDDGHAPARRTYEKAGFTGCPQVWYAKHLS